MNRISSSIATMVVAGAMITGCNKGVINAKKLDGEWTVASGEMTSTNSYTSGGTTTTTTQKSTYDGSKWSRSTTSGNTTTTVTEDWTAKITFDREAGTYIRVEESSNPEYNTYTITVYKMDSGGNIDWSTSETVEVTIARASTETTEGLYTLTGDAGEELEKNSQIVFQQRKREEKYTDTYSYKQGYTAFATTGYFWWDWNTGDYAALPSSKSETETNSGSSSDAEVWTIAEMAKGEMTVSFENENTYSNSGSTSSSSWKSSGTMTLKQ